jgi:Cutinase.
LQLGGGDGANDVIRRVKDAANVCPDTQLVLGGYSQGASVIDIVTGTQVGGISWGNQLPVEYADQVVAVTTFGNPPTAPAARSARRANCSAPRPSTCATRATRSATGPGNEWSDHTDGYIPALTSQAANFIAGRLRAAGPAPVQP